MSFEDHISLILEANEKYTENIKSIRDNSNKLSDTEKIHQISEATRDHAQTLCAIQFVAMMRRQMKKK